jgi:hypothetical protein
MSYYGGVWIDDRSILVEDLNWLKLQNMMLN